jgi:putative ABC transport system permease protein
VLSMTISLPSSKYSGGAQRVVFFRELVRRVEALPGVRAAGLVSHLPLAAGTLTTDFIVEGRIPLSTGEVPTAQLISVDAGYFRTLEIALVKGRAFVEGDAAERSPVAIVDEALARRFWPNQDPVGQHVRLGATIGADSAWRTIVGIAAAVRTTSLESTPRPAIYVPYYQTAWPTMSAVVRTAGEPARLAAAVRGEVLALDRSQPVYNVRTLEEVLSRTLASRRFQTMLLAGFAVAALALAVIGVYGVLAYAVAQRTRELGIRIALGARRRDVLAHVIRQAATLIGAGLLIGAAGALAGSRLLASLLFEVSPWDPAVFAGSVSLLAIAGLLASWAPARRATTVNPIVALRFD